MLSNGVRENERPTEKEKKLNDWLLRIGKNNSNSRAGWEATSDLIVDQVALMVVVVLSLPAVFCLAFAHEYIVPSYPIYWVALSFDLCQFFDSKGQLCFAHQESLFVTSPLVERSERERGGCICSTCLSSTLWN